MWDDIKLLFSRSRAFALALPVLFSIPVLIEFAQHVVEIDLGLYRHGLSAAAAIDQRRLALGFAKVLAMLLPGYWFVRYMAFGGDAARAKRIERPAAALFGIQFVLQAIAQWLALFGPPIDILLGMTPRLLSYVSLATGIGTAVIGVYLLAWLVAWPLGNVRIGPIRSIAVMAGSFWRSVAYLVAGTVPFMAVHYALAFASLGQPEWLVWPLMVMDALIVGFLALTTSGAGYLAAAGAAARSGVALHDDAMRAASR